MLKSFDIPDTDFDGLRLLLEQLTSDKVEVQNYLGGMSLRKVEINSAEGKVRLDLRSELYFHEGVYYQSLIIGVIALAPERMGIGTIVIEWLKNYARSKGFERICIENANTNASVGLARKMGFTNVPNSPIIQEVLKTEESPDYHLLLIRS